GERKHHLDTMPKQHSCRGGHPGDLTQQLVSELGLFDVWYGCRDVQTVYDQLQSASRQIALQVHAAGSGVNERIARVVHLCEHALSKVSHELSGILAECLAGRYASTDNANMINSGDANVVRRRT